ncbi:MAG: N-formylglutamate deformylase [Alphaproteobacteria bacterium]
MKLYETSKGRSPLLISVPHAGTHIPETLAARMTASAVTSPDADWHVDRLYNFAHDLDASFIVATHSRYVVDLNRPPDGSSLYPGQDVTELCPLLQFDKSPIYRPGAAPDKAETAARRDAYWQPYHDRLSDTLAEIRDAHGYALLWDAHSIRSVEPRFFEGRLPDINLGSGNGTACAGALAAELVAIAERAVGYSAILNGRFKGGHITRHYGDPSNGIHAMQLELSQITYMEEQPPYRFREDLANGIRPVLKQFLEAMLRWGRDHGAG